MKYCAPRARSEVAPRAPRRALPRATRRRVGAQARGQGAGARDRPSRARPRLVEQQRGSERAKPLSRQQPVAFFQISNKTERDLLPIRTPTESSTRASTHMDDAHTRLYSTARWKVSPGAAQRRSARPARTAPQAPHPPPVPTTTTTTRVRSRLLLAPAAAVRAASAAPTSSANPDRRLRRLLCAPVPRTRPARAAPRPSQRGTPASTQRDSPRPPTCVCYGSAAAIVLLAPSRGTDKIHS